MPQAYSSVYEMTVHCRRLSSIQRRVYFQGAPDAIFVSVIMKRVWKSRKDLHEILILAAHTVLFQEM